MDGFLCSALTSALSSGEDRFLGIATSQYISLSSTTPHMTYTLCDKTFSFDVGFILYWSRFSGSQTSYVYNVPFNDLFMEETPNGSEIRFQQLPPGIAAASSSTLLNVSTISPSGICINLNLYAKFTGSNIKITIDATLGSSITSGNGHALCTLFAIVFPA